MNIETTFRFHTGISHDEEEQPKRFVVPSDDHIKEMTKKKNSKNTENNTNFALRVLESFCKKTHTSFTDSNLDVLLSKLYISARTSKGENYKLNSLKSLRSSLQRYFLKERNVDIINNDVFRNSNLCYENKLKETKANGKGETNHYPEIEPEDLKKLYSSFDLETPTGLFEKVWFDIMFQLVRRGRENLRTMTKSSFAIGEDRTGLRYIYQCKSELDKNHNIKDNAFDTTGEGRIYETKTATCPVTSFLKYKCIKSRPRLFMAAPK